MQQLRAIKSGSTSISKVETGKTTNVEFGQEREHEHVSAIITVASQVLLTSTATSTCRVLLAMTKGCKNHDHRLIFMRLQTYLTPVFNNSIGWEACCHTESRRGEKSRSSDHTNESFTRKNHYCVVVNKRRSVVFKMSGFGDIVLRKWKMSEEKENCQSLTVGYIC